MTMMVSMSVAGWASSHVNPRVIGAMLRLSVYDRVSGGAGPTLPASCPSPRSWSVNPKKWRFTASPTFKNLSDNNEYMSSLEDA